MDMNQYLEIFIDETREHLQELNEALLALEKDIENDSGLNEIFRAAHTIKGMSGTMGFNKMSKLTHGMEDVLDSMRNNDIKVSTPLIDLLFKCFDALEEYLDNIVSTGNEGSRDDKELIDTLKSTINSGGMETAAKNAGPARNNEEEKAVNNILKLNEYDKGVIGKAAGMGMNAFQIHIELNEGCVLKSARAFVIFQVLEKSCDIIKSEPPVEDIEDEKFALSFTVVVVTRESDEKLDKKLNSIAEVDEVVITDISNAADFTTQIIHDSSEPEEEKPARDQSNEEPETKKPKTGKTVRVDIDRLDVLLNLVSELIIQKTRLADIGGMEKSQTFNETIEYLERITTSLHDAVMKVRMVAVERVFNRFPRMVRDVSKELGKEINLVMSGEETELDRTVIDEIGDPLIHLLRNSIDHGIEDIETRRKLGKADVGNVELKAYQEGNNVVIEVSDDGKGIMLDKVLKSAVDRGMVTNERAQNMTEEDIIQFLFAPSFSTVDVVTGLSGRGVGLDVVKSKIEALGGSVEVETQKDRGSRFLIRLPLTLAIIQALLIMVGKEKYAIPLGSVNRIINIKPEDVKMAHEQEVIMLQGEVVPLLGLDELLMVPERDPEKKKLTTVIVQKGERLSGIVVDSLIGQQEIVIKSLGKYLSGIPMIAGATILGDGNVALILDINTIV